MLVGVLVLVGSGVLVGDGVILEGSSVTLGGINVGMPGVALGGTLVGGILLGGTAVGGTLVGGILLGGRLVGRMLVGGNRVDVRTGGVLEAVGTTMTTIGVMVGVRVGSTTTVGTAVGIGVCVGVTVKIGRRVLVAVKIGRGVAVIGIIGRCVRLGEGETSVAVLIGVDVLLIVGDKKVANDVFVSGIGEADANCVIFIELVGDPLGVVGKFVGRNLLGCGTRVSVGTKATPVGGVGAP